MYHPTVACRFGLPLRYHAPHRAPTAFSFSFTFRYSYFIITLKRIKDARRLSAASHRECDCVAPRRRRRRRPGPCANDSRNGRNVTTCIPRLPYNCARMRISARIRISITMCLIAPIGIVVTICNAMPVPSQNSSPSQNHHGRHRDASIQPAAAPPACAETSMSLRRPPALSTSMSR